jgi:hypothetical protein
MTDVKKEVWAETYRYLCVRCGAVWSARFEVRRYTGVGGREWMVHCRGGRPVRSPHHDVPCAACGGLRVRILRGEASPRQTHVETIAAVREGEPASLAGRPDPVGA